MKWHNARRKINDLVPMPNNPRILTKKQAADLRRSLEKFDLVEIPAINTNGQIIAGHQRLKIMALLGRGDEEIDVRMPDRELTQAEVNEYCVRSNKNTGEWDFERLANDFELNDLLDWGFDEKELDFDAQSLNEIDAEPKIEQSAELQKKWGTAPGQIWQLGDHRIICGDCTDRGVVEKIMSDDKACCVFTDPPYGVSIGNKNKLLNEHVKGERCQTNIVNDILSPEDLKKILLPAFINTREIAMAEDCTVFVTAPQNGELSMMMMMMMNEAGLRVRHVLIWKKNKPTFSMGRLDYDYAHEPILLTWLKKHKRPMLGMHKTSVWEIDSPNASKLHPTMKPVELVENGLLNNSDLGDIVYEPFSGSGTAIIACERTGRKCRAVEIDPAYVAVAIERWAEATGKEPVKL